MNILVVSQYFWPENFLINDLVRTLDEQGHQVVVATGLPNYPGGDIPADYQRGRNRRQHFADGVEVQRVGLLPRGNASGWRLALNYLSFALNGVLTLPRRLAGRQFDAILCYAPSPILSALPAIALRRRLGCPLLLWVQDIWPESLQATGHVNNTLILNAVDHVTRWIYRQCDQLLVPSFGFIDRVSDQAGDVPVTYYPNSVRVQADGPVPPAPAELTDLLNSRFCAVFAGNLGTAQDPETLLQAAVALADEPDILLLAIGDGSRAAWLREQAQRLAPNHLKVFPALPRSTVDQLLTRAGCLLVTLRPTNVFASTLPSKVQTYLAAGRPILAATDGEGARVVEQAGAGLACSAGDHQSLADNIRRLRDMTDGQRQAMGDAGRAWFTSHFDMATMSGTLVNIIEQQIQTRARSGFRATASNGDAR